MSLCPGTPLWRSSNGHRLTLPSGTRRALSFTSVSWSFFFGLSIVCLFGLDIGKISRLFWTGVLGPPQSPQLYEVLTPVKSLHISV
jgi:hypothetical protein